MIFSWNSRLFEKEKLSWLASCNIISLWIFLFSLARVRWICSQDSDRGDPTNYLKLTCRVNERSQLLNIFHPFFWEILTNRATLPKYMNETRPVLVYLLCQQKLFLNITWKTHRIFLGWSYFFLKILIRICWTLQVRSFLRLICKTFCFKSNALFFQYDSHR